MDRVILHCDCNGFYASVEGVLRPALQAVPMAVCGDPKSRHGIILAKNEPAKRFGIQTAETVWMALRKCPELTLVAPHREEYVKYSKQINAIYERYTDLVEPFGIDESWLDVTGSVHLFGSGVEIADALRRTVREETGLTISAGVSFNKIFAKMGSDYQKPDATTEISRENYRALLWPMSVSNLLYVGDAVQKKLSDLYIETIGQLAQADPTRLIARLGKLGGELHAYANGRDDSPVRSAYEPREIKSIGNGMTFRRDLVGPADLRVGLEALCDEVAGRLRREGLLCRTVQVQIKDTHLRVISRQRPLDAPTALASELAEAALALVCESWNLSIPIRMLTVTGCGLIPAEGEARQLSLFGQDEQHERRQKLETAIDAVRGRYGRGSLSTGAILGSDIGVGEPAPEDERSEDFPPRKGSAGK
ncbi:MAG: DNA polymerase IV [Oscillospiraceae bacterium]